MELNKNKGYVKHGAKRGHGGALPPQRKMCAPLCPPKYHWSNTRFYWIFVFFILNSSFYIKIHIIYPFPCSARLSNRNKGYFHRSYNSLPSFRGSNPAPLGGLQTPRWLPRSLTRPRYFASLIKKSLCPPTIKSLAPCLPQGTQRDTQGTHN